MAFVPPARHLLRAKDLADARYADPLTVDDLAGAAGLSRAHFSREFRDAFDEPGLYFGTSTGQVFASADEGESWTEIASYLPAISSVEVAVLP